MTIRKRSDGRKLEIWVEGRLDMDTAPQLEAELNASLDGVREVVFDLSGLEYISSAGLRALFIAKKAMNRARGTMKTRNANPDIREVFESTGFADILGME